MHIPSVPRTDAPERAVSTFDRPVRVDNNEPFDVAHVDLNAVEGERESPFFFIFPFFGILL